MLNRKLFGYKRSECQFNGDHVFHRTDLNETLAYSAIFKIRSNNSKTQFLQELFIHRNKCSNYMELMHRVKCTILFFFFFLLDLH